MPPARPSFPGKPAEAGAGTRSPWPRCRGNFSRDPTASQGFEREPRRRAGRQPGIPSRRRETTRNRFAQNTANSSPRATSARFSQTRPGARPSVGEIASGQMGEFGQNGGNNSKQFRAVSRSNGGNWAEPPGSSRRRCRRRSARENPTVPPGRSLGGPSAQERAREPPCPCRSGTGRAQWAISGIIQSIIRHGSGQLAIRVGGIGRNWEKFRVVAEGECARDPGAEGAEGTAGANQLERDAQLVPRRAGRAQGELRGENWTGRSRPWKSPRRSAKASQYQSRGSALFSRIDLSAARVHWHQAGAIGGSGFAFRVGAMQTTKNSA